MTPCALNAVTATATAMVAALLSAFPTALRAAAECPEPVPSMQFTAGLAGGQNKLTWQAEPGVSYRIWQSVSLSPGKWLARAKVDAQGTSGHWIDPEPAPPRAFYFIEPPQPEVLQVEPAVLSSGRVLVIRANCLPAGSSIVFTMDNGDILSAPLTDAGPGMKTAMVPTFQRAYRAAISAQIVDANGLPVCPVGQTLMVSESGFASDGSPPSPPAPLGGVAIPKFLDLTAQARVAAEKADIGAIKAGIMNFAAGSAAAGARFGRPVVNVALTGTGGRRPGEVCVEHCGMFLETPAGPPLMWSHIYRSQTEPISVVPPAAGTYVFEFTYDVSVQPVPAAAGAAAPVVEISADGRRDLMIRRADGVYVCDGMFREGRFSGDVFTLTFADKSTWTFKPLSTAGSGGKLDAVTDRNGVAVTCTYGPTGQLSKVSSQFGQSLTIGRDTAGRVETVTDQNGCFITYEWYQQGEAGGNPGDLKSVSCPKIPGQAAAQGPVTYTYSTGSPDPRLNGNVLTITDGAGKLQSGFIYATAPAASPYYDRCIAWDRQSTGPGDPVVHFSYEFTTRGLVCTRNDEAGRVTMAHCDFMYLPQRMQWFTTHAVPGIPVTSTSNLPPAPGDPTEPPFVQRSFFWNPDHQCTRCIDPDGLETRITYDRELRRDCPVRERGNECVITLRSPAGEERTVSRQYLSGFGTAEGTGIKRARIETYIDPSDHPGSAWSFKEGWPCRWEGPELDAAVYGNPIGGISVKGGKNPPGLGKPEGRATGGDADPEDYNCDGNNNFAMRPGNPIPGLLRGKGGGKLSSVKSNPLYQQSGNGGENPLYEGSAFHSNPLFESQGSGGVNPLFESNRDFCTRLVTTAGQVFTQTFDGHGNLLSRTTPIPGSGALYTWNGNGQCTSVTTLNGPGSSYRDEIVYDAASGWQTGYIYDKAVDGTGLKITAACTRDPWGRIISLTDPRGFTSLIAWNACGQVTSVSSPPVGPDPLTAARIVTSYFYDGSGLPVRSDTEHRDSNGIIVTNNPLLTTINAFDARGRLTQTATEQKPVDVPPGIVSVAALGLSNFDVTDFTLNAAGDCVRVSKPAECRDQAVGEVCDATYNALGQTATVTPGGTGTPDATTVEYRYAPHGGVVVARKVASGGGVSPTVSCTYDEWRRVSSCTDETGNVVSYSYGNDGFVTTEVHGEMIDVDGSAGNVLLARGRGRPSIKFGYVFWDSPHAAKTGQKAKAWMVNNYEVHSVFGLKTEWITSMGMPKITPKIAKESHGKRSLPPAFFEVCVADEECVWERFAPGEPAPHATETTVVYRSPAGQPLSVTRNGDVLYLFGGYDSAGRLVSWSQPGAVTVTSTLDACGNETACTVTAHSSTPGGPNETYSTTAAYDALNRRTSITDSVGNSESFSRDSAGRITGYTSPGGLTAACAWDVMSSTGYSTCECTADFDADGLTDYRVSSVTLGGVRRSDTDAAGYRTVYTTDSQSRLSRVDYPDGTFETWTRNEFGQTKVHRRKSGAIMAADYNYKSQCTRLTVSNLTPDTVPVPPTEYFYNGLGFCVRKTEGTSVIMCTFDSLGNKLSESQNGHTVTHTYDHRGCNGSTHPDGSRYREVRNAHGQLLTLSALNSAGVALSPPITQHAYCGFVAVADTCRNGVVTTRDFRSDGEQSLPLAGGSEDFTFGGCVRTTVTAPDGTVLEDHIIRRNHDQCETVHHRVFGGGAAPPSRRQTFTLNRRNQVIGCLTQVREVAGGPVITESDVHYTLDARGQRLSATGGRNPGVYTSSDTAPLFDHQMAQPSTWPGGLIIWRDDGDASFIGDSTGGKSFSYDGKGRVVAITDANGLPMVSCTWDADGRLLSSTVPGATAAMPPVTTWFIYDGSMCLQQLDSNGVPEVSYVVASGLRQCISTKNGSTYYPHGGSGGGSDNGTAHSYPYPILDIMWTCLEPMEEADVSLDLRTSGLGWVSGWYTMDSDVCTASRTPSYRTCSCPPGQHVSVISNSQGQAHERCVPDEGGAPIILNGAGQPLPAPSFDNYKICYSVDGVSWFPNTRICRCPPGLYYADLGRLISTHKHRPGYNIKENKK